MAEGCYKDPYLPASYRGVPFEAMDITVEVGRRVAKGEFPFAEVTAYADLGRKIRSYKVSARFAQNAHVLQARALMDMCEAPGAGILVHPTYGVLSVICESASLKDNPLEEQGVSYVELSFCEAQDPGNGFHFGAAFVAITLNAIFAAAETSFLGSYNPQQVRFYQASQVVATASEAISAVENEFILATRNDTSNKVYEARAEFQTLKNDPGVLLNAKPMWESLTLGMAAVDKYTTGNEKFGAFRRLANWAAQEPNLSGEAAANQDALYTAVRLLSAGYMARALSEEIPTSISQALGQYEVVVSVLNDEYGRARVSCDSFLQLAISGFTTQVETVLLYRAYQLPPTLIYDFSGGVHSLVAAYEIYGDAKRSREIEKRNPGYMPFSSGPTIASPGA